MIKTKYDWQITAKSYQETFYVTLSHDHNNYEDDDYCGDCDGGYDTLQITCEGNSHEYSGVPSSWKRILIDEIRGQEGYKTIFRGAISRIKKTRSPYYI